MTTIDKATTRNRPAARCPDRKVSRRGVLKGATAVAATTFTPCRFSNSAVRLLTL